MLLATSKREQRIRSLPNQHFEISTTASRQIMKKKKQASFYGKYET